MHIFISDFDDQENAEESDVVESCDSESHDEGEESEEEDENNEVESGEEQFSDEEDGKFKNISKSSSHTKKGQSVKNQLKIWEGLLEMRIQLQKSTVSANKLPTGDLWKTFAQEIEFSEAVDKTKKTVSNTLNKLLELQNVLLGQYSETKKLLKQKKAAAKTKEGSDEEIPSDTEEENEPSSNDDEEEQENVPVKRRKLNDYEAELKKVHAKYTPYRNTVINQWNEKTRLDTKNLSSNSVLSQIQHLLNDKTRLVRRSQLKKSQYDIIGEKTEEEKEEMKQKRFVEEHNSNVYDDDDFYHQLLRELIEVKSADITDPVQLSRQWVQLQSLRNKMKKKVDTKCSKGRKIRYTVHNKLVNFMAPIDNSYGNYDTKHMVLDSIFK